MPLTQTSVSREEIVLLVVSTSIKHILFTKEALEANGYLRSLLYFLTFKEYA